MKLMLSTMLTAAIKRQYSSVLPLLAYVTVYQLLFNKICGTAMVTLIKNVNKTADLHN